MDQTAASAFRSATDTRVISGPDHLQIQLSYTPTVAQATGVSWIPLRPNPSGVTPGNRGIQTRSWYVNAEWNALPHHRVVLTSTVETMHGTYSWTTNAVLPAQQATLLSIYRGWHYPVPITPTEAVHALTTVRQSNPPTTVTAWHRTAGAVLTAGLPATGEAPWYLFTTANRGESWQLTYVSSGAPSHHQNGFPNTSPSDVLTAMAWTGPHTLWIAQTINCMSGPEVSGGTVTLTTSTNGGQSWHLVANRIHESNDYCPTMLRLSLTSRAKQPTVRLIERNAMGTHVKYSWFPKQWS